MVDYKICLLNLQLTGNVASNYRKFEQVWKYPHVLDVIDGKHVRVVNSNKGGLYFYNYKHTHSIIILAIVGTNALT